MRKDEQRERGGEIYQRNEEQKQGGGLMESPSLKMQLRDLCMWRAKRGLYFPKRIFSSQEDGRRNLQWRVPGVK